MAMNGETINDTMIRIMPEIFRTGKPTEIKTAPIRLPMSAYDELEGVFRYHIAKSQKIAPNNPAIIITSFITV